MLTIFVARKPAKLVWMANKTELGKPCVAQRQPSQEFVYMNARTNSHKLNLAPPTRTLASQFVVDICFYSVYIYIPLLSCVGRLICIGQTPRLQLLGDLYVLYISTYCIIM